jgi:hypothetical protein
MEAETKKFGCNQCVCHRNSWACTDFTCPSTEAPLQLPETAGISQVFRMCHSHRKLLCGHGLTIRSLYSQFLILLFNNYQNPAKLKRT